MREETSLELAEAEPMALYSGRDQQLTYPNGDEIQCFAIAFIVRKWSGEPRADGVEGSALRFWPLNALPTEVLRIHRATLDDYRRHAGRFLCS